MAFGFDVIVELTAARPGRGEDKRESFAFADREALEGAVFSPKISKVAPMLQNLSELVK